MERPVTSAHAGFGARLGSAIYLPQGLQHLPGWPCWHLASGTHPRISIHIHCTRSLSGIDVDGNAHVCCTHTLSKLVQLLQALKGAAVMTEGETLQPEIATQQQHIRPQYVHACPGFYVWHWSHRLIYLSYRWWHGAAAVTRNAGAAAVNPKCRHLMQQQLAAYLSRGINRLSQRY